MFQGAGYPIAQPAGRRNAFGRVVDDIREVGLEIGVRCLQVDDARSAIAALGYMSSKM
jgi:hypothetical protein